METGRKKMNIKRLSIDGEHWTKPKPIWTDNEADVDKATGGYAATRWRKKPVEVDAIRWTGANEADVLAFCDGAASIINGWLRIATLEGTHVAMIGDYIIRGVNGEYYPCKADIFEMTYERV